MKQARTAEKEIAAGKYRGPLHGIPYAAKDLLAVKGYPTTWGARPYLDQRFDYDATVIHKLESAGAVLIGAYWATRSQVLSVTSAGGTEIVVPVRAMPAVSVIEFIDAVEREKLSFLASLRWADLLPEK